MGVEGDAIVLTWALAFTIKGAKVEGDAGCIFFFAMILDTVIVLSLSNVALSWIAKAVF